MLFLLVLSLCITQLKCMLLAKVSNVTFVDHYATSITISYNRSCHECICKFYSQMQSASIVGFNCFENVLATSRTCEFFYNISSMYQIAPNNDSQFYFIQFPPTISVTMTTETLTTQQIREFINPFFSTNQLNSPSFRNDRGYSANSSSLLVV